MRTKWRSSPCGCLCAQVQISWRWRLLGWLAGRLNNNNNSTAARSIGLPSSCHRRECAKLLGGDFARARTARFRPPLRRASIDERLFVQRGARESDDRYTGHWRYWLLARAELRRALPTNAKSLFTRQRVANSREAALKPAGWLAGWLASLLAASKAPMAACAHIHVRAEAHQRSRRSPRAE